MPAPAGEFCARTAPADAASAMPMLTTIPTIFLFTKASLLTHRPVVAGTIHSVRLLQRLQLSLSESPWGAFLCVKLYPLLLL